MILTENYLLEKGAKKVGKNFVFDLYKGYKRDWVNLKLIVNYDKAGEAWWFEYVNQEIRVSLPPKIRTVAEFNRFYKAFTGKPAKAD